MVEGTIQYIKNLSGSFPPRLHPRKFKLLFTPKHLIMDRRFLILHPERIMGLHSTYSHVLPEARLLQPVVQMDASRKCNPSKVKQAVLSGDFSVILVCDLSRDQRWFTAQFRSCLRAFVHAGGAVAFVAHSLPPVAGGFLIYNVIKPIFRLPWTQGL